MYKLVAIDLDGTLLDSEKNVSNENIEAVRQVIERGVKVVICSGRVHKAAEYYAQAVKTFDPVISCNGAVITEQLSGGIIYDNPLEVDSSRKIVDICHRAGVYFHAYVHNEMYTETIAYDALQYRKFNERIAQRHNIKINLIEDFSVDLSTSLMPVSKFVVISEDMGRLAELRKEIEVVENVEVSSSDHNNLEIYRLGVNKGEALKYLSRRLGIEREETVAIGDNENDFSMISYAGLGIAMGNALQSIKEISGYVTLDHEENGVAYALRKFFF